MVEGIEDIITDPSTRAQFMELLNSGKFLSTMWESIKQEFKDLFS